MSILERIFGANWRTTVYGGLTAILGTLQQSNYAWVGWMQEVFGTDMGGRLEKLVLVLCMIFGVQTARAMKDRQVTGTGSEVNPHAVKTSDGLGDRPVEPPKA